MCQPVEERSGLAFAGTDVLHPVDNLNAKKL